jgi:DNA polymerase I-like protein with 3'-5' exonuclease and polymerase domains
MMAIRFECSLHAHHSYASHLPQKLDQLISVYCDSGPWKIQFGRRGASAKKQKTEEMTGEDLCKYNAADCRVTIKAWKALQKDLATERRTYDHDMCLLELCSDMERVGVRVDVKRQQELSAAMETAAEGYREEMRHILGDPEFRVTTARVQKALYDVLAVRKLHFTEKGAPATGKVVIESLKSDDTDAGRFATALSKWRELMKIKVTYVDFPTEIMFPLKREMGLYATDPHRAHYGWGPRERRNQPTAGGGHTVSGRLACRLQSMPRYNPRNLADRAREIYVPAPGNIFTYFDVSQGEPRVAAFLSGDPERIKTTYGDVHAENAKIMFPEVAAKGWLDGPDKKDPTRGKPIRDLAKTMGLAIDYFAEAETAFAYMSQNRFGPDGKALFGLPKLGTVAAMISKIRFRYKRYVQYVTANLETVKRTGYMRSPVLGRIRWFGWFAAITYIANFPVQSTLADVMNLRSLFLQGHPRFFAFLRKYPEIAEKVSLPKKPIRLPKGVQIVGQIHDSCIFENPRYQEKAMKEILAEVWAAPIRLDGGDLILPIDCKSGGRLSEL